MLYVCETKQKIREEMFDKDFYPTPRHAMDLMEINVAGKNVLEPHGGSGNLIDFIKFKGASRVYTCETHPKLKQIAKNKATFIKDDFLSVTPEEVYNIDCIVMNPPFSCQEKHIEHAWEIAPSGATIWTLCNIDSLETGYRAKRSVKSIAEEHGFIRNLGNIFSSEAERKTDVNIGLIVITKPLDRERLFSDEFFFDTEAEEFSTQGLMPYNEIEALVGSYRGACQDFLKVEESLNSINSKLKKIDMNSISANLNQGEIAYDVAQFSQKMKVRYWRVVFDKLNINKYLTSQVKEDIDKYFNENKNMQFTVSNIYRLVEMIVGNRENIITSGVVEAIDKFTRHTHKNRFNVEGWKTNCGYMLNQKFIIGFFCEEDWSTPTVSVNYGQNTEKLRDLTKVLCNLTGEDYEKIIDIREVGKRIETNRWYDYGFFEFKAFKKGSGHFRFKCKEHWELLNRRYAEAKGASLPEKL